MHKINNSTAAERYQCLVDKKKGYLLLIITLFFTCVACLIAWILKESGDVNWLFLILVSGCLLAISGLYLRYLRHFMTTVVFLEEELICTRWGHTIKTIPWTALRQTWVFDQFYSCGGGGDITRYICIAAHELTDEEKKVGVFLAGLKNDIVIVPYSDKVQNLIPEECRPAIVDRDIPFVRETFWLGPRGRVRCIWDSGVEDGSSPHT